MICAHYCRQDLSCTNRRGCEAQQSHLYVQNLTQPWDLISSGAAALQKLINLKLPAGLCGASAFLEENRDTCAGFCLLLFGLLLHGTSGYHRLRTVSLAVYSIIQAVFILLNPFHNWLPVSWDKPRMSSSGRHSWLLSINTASTANTGTGTKQHLVCSHSLLVPLSLTFSKTSSVSPRRICCSCYYPFWCILCTCSLRCQSQQ